MDGKSVSSTCAHIHAVLYKNDGKQYSLDALSISILPSPTADKNAVSHKKTTLVILA